jgi:hypothetical protein
VRPVSRPRVCFFFFLRGTKLLHSYGVALDLDGWNWRRQAGRTWLSWAACWWAELGRSVGRQDLAEASGWMTPPPRKEGRRRSPPPPPRGKRPAIEIQDGADENSLTLDSSSLSLTAPLRLYSSTSPQCTSACTTTSPRLPCSQFTYPSCSPVSSLLSAPNCLLESRS